MAAELRKAAGSWQRSSQAPCHRLRQQAPGTPAQAKESEHPRGARQSSGRRLEPARESARPMAMKPQFLQARSPHARIRQARVVVSRCVLGAACAALVAACGSVAAPASSAAGSGTSSHSAAGSGTATTTSAAKVSLVVSFSGSPSSAASRYTLRCDPTGGTEPDAAAACAKLLKITDLFSPLPPHVMCPMILANAGQVSITGYYFGKRVHETYLDGGCDLARWSQLRQVFN